MFCFPSKYYAIEVLLCRGFRLPSGGQAELGLIALVQGRARLIEDWT